MQAMRRLCALIAALMLSAGLSVPTRALEAFEITAFDIQMTVRDDNSYQITETISVSYSEQRRGIIRSIPLKTYRGKAAGISDVRVSGHKYAATKAGGNLEIKIGDSNRFAAPSEKYVISYLYTIGDDGLKDMDELYWNLIGTDWECPIDNVTFTIIMPRRFDDSRLNFTYGKKGSVKNDAVTWYVDDQTIRGVLQIGLAPKEALTVALPLPQGYFTSAKPLKVGLMASFGWLIPLATMGIGFALWILLGKKRQSFPTVEFYPPQGVTSADAGFLIDGRVDPFDITSLIIYWADRGYLSITEQVVKKGFGTKKNFLLTRLKNPTAEAREYEHEMYQELFYLGNGYQVSTDQLTNRFYTTAEQVKRQVKNSFEGEPETRIFAATNTLCRWILRIAAFLGLLPCAYAALDSLGDGAGIALLGQGAVFSLLIVIFLFALLQLLADWKGLPKKGRIKQLTVSIMLSGLFCGLLFYASMSSGMLFTGAASVVSAVMLGAMAAKCSRRTTLGVWYEERLTGFKAFLEATELDRIKLLVEENPQYFYHVLPFAMVLGVTDKWAKNFEQIAVAPPDWYHASAMYGGFRAAQFARDLEAGMRVVSSDMSARPSSGSGGSSDGGSAGGGSGGGGGRSW